MKRRYSCQSAIGLTDRQEPPEMHRVQPFPTTGTLVRNLNLPFSSLAARTRNAEARSYSYVVRSVRLNQEANTFEQHGSAPNFQGKVLTLCTCKHQMRASQTADSWKGVWIAGFTSRMICDGKHWLFYLAQIESAYESHSDLWCSLSKDTRNSKAAHENYLGDVFKPKTPKPKEESRFLPNRYVAPVIHAHRQTRSDRGWRNDISYNHAKKFGHPSLLIANPRMTFLWEEPMIFLAQKHCRNYLKWDALPDLIQLLRGAGL